MSQIPEPASDVTAPPAAGPATGGVKTAGGGWGGRSGAGLLVARQAHPDLLAGPGQHPHAGQ